MSRIELETGARERGGSRPTRVTSRKPRDGSRQSTPVAPGLSRGPLARLRESVWAPVVLKALGIGLGMLALAAIGASSIARGAGVPSPAPSAAAAHLGLEVGTLGGARGGSRSGSAERVAEPPGPPAVAPRDSEPTPTDAGSAPSGVTADGKVILNRASAEELCRLPGIGPKRALAILELRQKLGRFKRVSDLLRLKGIGPKGLKKIEARAVLDAP